MGKGVVSNIMVAKVSIEQELGKEKKSTKRFATIFTMIYVILFPFLFYMAMLSGMIFDNPHMTNTLGLTIIFTTFCIPLSIPVSIYLIWSRYLRGQYKKAVFFCWLPLLTLVVVCFLIEILPFFIR